MENVNWSRFEVEGGDRIELRLGEKYEVGICSIKQTEMEVEDKEKTAEGTIKAKKIIPALVLGIDFFAGKPAKKELMVTSKKWVQTIKTYYEKDMLFTRIFQLEKSGTGFQTTYQMIALQDKPKDRSKDAEAFI